MRPTAIRVHGSRHPSTAGEGQDFALLVTGKIASVRLWSQDVSLKQSLLQVAVAGGKLQCRHNDWGSL